MNQLEWMVSTGWVSCIIGFGTGRQSIDTTAVRNAADEWMVDLATTAPRIASEDYFFNLFHLNNLLLFYFIWLIIIWFDFIDQFLLEFIYLFIFYLNNWFLFD